MICCRYCTLSIQLSAAKAISAVLSSPASEAASAIVAHSAKSLTTRHNRVASVHRLAVMWAWSTAA